MKAKIFINMPVKDLNKSIDFFTKLGFSFNPQFTDEKSACLIISEGTIYAMLLTESAFKKYTKKEIADSKKTTEMLISLSLDSKEKVENMITNVINAGGSLYSAPEDYGWIFQHSFADLDGHQWELFYMDESKLNHKNESDKLMHVKSLNY